MTGVVIARGWLMDALNSACCQWGVLLAVVAIIVDPCEWAPEDIFLSGVPIQSKNLNFSTILCRVDWSDCMGCVGN